jgi:hypothetical protein
MSMGRPVLPDEYQEDIIRAGGWYNWRDAVLLENSRSPDIAMVIRKRIYAREKQSRKVRAMSAA